MMTLPDETIRERLQDVMDERGHSHREVSGMMGASPGYLGNFLRFRMLRVGNARAAGIATYLGMDRDTVAAWIERDALAVEEADAEAGAWDVALDRLCETQSCDGCRYRLACRGAGMIGLPVFCEDVTAGELRALALRGVDGLVMARYDGVQV